MSIVKLLRGLLAGFFVFVGVTHFTDPDPFVAIVPPYLPQPLALVYVSGVFEILGGLGLLIPRLRRPAGWGLVALLVAVYPANVHMALNDVPFRGQVLPAWGHAIRLPLQFVMIGLVAWVCGLLPSRRRDRA